MAICERGGDEAGGAERSIATTLEDGQQTDSEAEETSSPGVPDTAVKEKPATREGLTLPSNDFSRTTEGTKSVPGCPGPASPGKPDDPGVTSIETP
ncbi:hypothetical protein E2C01_040373 [Portunus trituberculatus]|uniref:Uncharacterized protein n=1 Tax=Portunus trituberculatus TaxID=210409 RepID=A0A5B7FGB9_PORTR|nr:hypothetical protein [Portunus trituberculatus]